MILSFRTDWSGQIVQTQIRLLLEEQSDQSLHYLQNSLHLLDALLYGKTSDLNLRVITPNIFGIQKFRTLQYLLKNYSYSLFLRLYQTLSSQSPVEEIWLSKPHFYCFKNEPRHGKNGFLHMRKQRRRSALT